ncbi:DUF637 domain-containing protein [Burkholderia glumae]|nr:DUF637 domain-containing protein [Burkholderia glumae]ACR31227.1 Adhesin HecA family protein [Burkholderia glumae BGR1]
MSVVEQEKAYLYQNAIDYAKQNNLQLGQALSQTQVNQLTQPMLWYVEQTVPDPSCTATGTGVCPTITALMPQVYLPQGTAAMTAGGNITGGNVALNFNTDGNGSILNTGSISASGTLAVNTQTLTNQANQVNVGQIWQKVDGGYLDTTGTTVQPGGFMSAANMELNVQRLNQIGGALQQLNPDGGVDQAGTQALLAQLQSTLGGNFTQKSVSDDLHQDFVKEGGAFGLDQLGMLVVAVASSLATYGAASAAIGTALGAAGGTFATASTAAGVSAGLGNAVLSAAIAGVVSSSASQLVGTGKLDLGSAFEAGAVAAITAGLMNGITYSNQSGLGFTTSPIASGSGVQSLGSLAGVQPVVGTSVNQAAGSTATLIEERGLAMLASGVINAGVGTAIEGGSFLSALKGSLVSEVAAVGANAIGDEANVKGSPIEAGSPAYWLAHAALGCASSAALGTGCAGGAIGGATSAVLSPWVIGQIDPSGAPLDQGQVAAVTALATMAGGAMAGLAGQNAMAGATAAQNEALNNATQHVGPSNGMLSKVCAATNPACSDQMIQTLNNAQAQNATMALGNMNAAAPYVAGALGVSLFGPEAIATAVTAGAYDYFGDLYSYRTGLQPDQPNFTKSYIAGVIGGLAYPFAIADEAISGMSKVGKIAANGYNAGVAGVGAFGSAAVTRQDNPDLSGGLGSGLAAVGTWAKATLPAPFGNIANQTLQGAAGPIQNVIQKALGH